jgi:hypothetical protein
MFSVLCSTSSDLNSSMDQSRLSPLIDSSLQTLSPSVRPISRRCCTKKNSPFLQLALPRESIKPHNVSVPS